MEEIDEERVAFCALNRIFGFDPAAGSGLVEKFGGAAAIFRQPQEVIEEALGGYSKIRFASQITESAFESAAMELERLASKGCRFIGLSEPGYPELLKECADAPLGLYFKGISSPEEVFGRIPCIAVVGTRKLTSYGKDWCERIVASMSKASVKPLIVSGLAIGVDVTAHKAALDSGLPTVAVMATGIEDLYPELNRAAGEKIASTEGCALVTDFPPGTEALKVNFLRRNRIIAGICQATILVESRIKGGGMMTARLAASYDREVFALPGRMDDPVSQGCNLLIRETLAEPVGDLGEFVARLGLGKSDLKLKEDFKEEVENRYRDQLQGAELESVVRLALTIKSHRGISLDELCSKLSWTYATVSRYTSLLECDGFISVDLLQHCHPDIRRD